MHDREGVCVSGKLALYISSCCSAHGVEGDVPISAGETGSFIRVLISF